MTRRVPTSVSRLVSDLSCEATRIALVGYSQGADAAGDLAAEIGTGPDAPLAQRVWSWSG
ncbi:hypothetical protein [Nocardia asiatica]|uniref:hypothetical protein n=1 Tax=Nocardia asiatica TaxID=209252 RepID=UPI002458F9A9|nr:hypothetical protein [Nocardia asiatica]